MIKEFINIAALCPQTIELGPGKRFALWVQGCPFQCKGCIAPDWIPLKQAQLISIENLAQQILASDIEGVTISGGEPFLQASKLSSLLNIVLREKPTLTVIVFTGFSLKQLDWVEAKTFLLFIDVLKTGLYVDKLNDGKGLRGSSNQEFHFLTDKLKSFESYFQEKGRQVELHLSDDGVFMVGIPPKDFIF